MIDEQINTGVLHGRKETDYLAGVNSPIGYEVIVQDGQWNPWRPKGERQSAGSGTDKMECVTQSFNKSVATQMNRMIKLNIMPAPHLKFLKDYGYIDETGRVNFNERLSAILNETMPEGNWLHKVADKAREYGLFPHGIMPDDKSLPWNEYYDKRLATAARLEIGKKFKEFFELPTEWVAVNGPEMLKHLKQAPLQVVFPSHAVPEMYQYGVNPTDDVEYFDSYGTIGNDQSFIKRKDISRFTSAMKIMVTLKKVVEKRRTFKVNQKGQLGVLFLEGQAGAGLFEDDYTEYQQWLKFVKAEDAPTIEIPLGKYFAIDDMGKRGIMIVEGYVISVVFEDKWEEYQQLLKITGAAPNVPVIYVPRN